MTKAYPLIVGFSKSESERIITHFNKLLAYLSPDNFVVVGGLAIRYHLISRGLSYPQRPFNDLDIIVKSSSIFSPSVSKDFLIYHYHPDHDFLALVDPVSRTKVDIFRYDSAPKKVVQVAFANKNINVVSAEDQLARTVSEIQRISSEAHVDPKQFLDTKLLFKIADLRKADRIWQSYKFNKYPQSLKKAIERAELIAEKHPEWITEYPFRKPKPFKCPDCKDMNGFQVAPMEEIYKILKYIE